MNFPRLLNPWTLFGAAVLLLAGVLQNDYYLTLINFIGIHTLLVVGLNLLMGYAGQISLGHAAFFGLGAYTSGILTATYGVNPWLAMLAGLLVCGITAFLIGVPALKLRGYYLAMATLGFGIIVYIFLNEAQALTGGPSGLAGIPALSIFGFQLDTPKRLYLLIWPVLGGILALSANLVYSRTGRALKALHDGEAAAQSLGVNTSRLKLKIFVWSALYASLAGSFYAVLTVLPEILTMFHDYESIIFGAILMVVMIFLPRGLVRGIMDLWEFRRYKKEGGIIV
jgi:branched-chain amino acid transport system permease protein